MSTPPSAPILQIKPRARYDYLQFYWEKPRSSGINNFQPDQISSMSLWLDPSDSSTMNIGAAEPYYITEVRDKKTGAVFKPKGAPGNYLMAQTNTLNGKQSIWFNNRYANNVYLEGSYNMPLVGSIFMVFTAREQFFQSWRAIFGTPTDNTPRFTYVNGLNNVIAPGITYNNFPGTPATTLIPGKSYMFYYSWNGSKTNVGLWGYPPIQGVNPEAIKTTATILRIGRDVYDYANTNLCEMLMFNAELTNSQRQNMEGYLSWKWGLVNLLPPNHPYKTINPSDGGPSAILGYTLSCPSLPFISTYSATTRTAYINDPRLQHAIDYDFSLIAYNMHGDSPPARFMTTQIGLLPANVFDVNGAVIAPGTVDMSWDFTYTYPEAITKWFVITATPSVRGYNTVLKSCQGSERARAITNLSPQIYTIKVQAENNVGYSYPEPRNTITIPVNVDIGSLDFNGFSYLQFPGVHVGTNAFSFECFFSPSAISLVGTFLGSDQDGLSISIQNSNTIAVTHQGVSTTLFTVPSILVGTWYHLAVCRDKYNNTTVFLNGIRSSTGVVQDTNYYAVSQYIGAVNNGGLADYFYGNISQIRLVIFTTEYDPLAATITIPAQPLPITTCTKFIMFTPFSQHYLIESGPYYFSITNKNVASSELRYV